MREVSSDGKIRSGSVKDGEGGLAIGGWVGRTCMLSSGCSTGSYIKMPRR